VVLCGSVELRNLVKMPAYTLSVLAAVFAAFLLAGYYTNAARFVELQFGYDYQHAWFYTNGRLLYRLPIYDGLHLSHSFTSFVISRGSKAFSGISVST